MLISSITRNLAITATVFFSVNAFAQTAPSQSTSTMRSATIDQRQANQQGRIAQGVASGQLTPREATRLQKREGTVMQMEDRAKADGTVTKREAAAINKKQNSVSRGIYRQKHDAQRDLNHDGVKDKHVARVQK